MLSEGMRDIPLRGVTPATGKGALGTSRGCTEDTPSGRRARHTVTTALGIEPKG